jgi:multidrug efflux pump subunit AcrA (membrane-fusion protein)
MKHINRWLVVMLLIFAALQLAACSQGTVEADKIEPAQVEPIEGTELNRVILTEQAAQRLDLQTDQVREEQVEGTQRLVVPYSAVIYDLEGKTWIYISPALLTYMREPITVDYIEGDMVVLTDGPASGTEVVTVGVPELYGADTGVGK